LGIDPDDDDILVKFKYDYMGRRVCKQIYIYDDGWPNEGSKRGR